MYVLMQECIFNFSKYLMSKYKDCLYRNVTDIVCRQREKESMWPLY